MIPPRGRLALWAALLTAVASVSGVSAQERTDAWPSLRGSGLVTLPDARVLERGRVLAGVAVNNRDRDPLGLDLLDGSLLFAAGLGGGFEAYGEAVLSRVVAMPELPVLPPPPVDIVVAPGAAAPGRPLYAFYAPVPYVNKRGTARFDDWVRGDAVLGLKYRLAEGSGTRPELSVSGELTLPLTRDVAKLQSGAGTGAVDLGARMTAGWGTGPTRLVATAVYTRTGNPPLVDRIVTVAGGTGVVEDLPLELADRFEVGAGVRHALTERLALVAEGSAVFEVGARTDTVDSKPPADLLGGVQTRWGAVRLTAALRYHGRSLPSGEERRSPVAGLVDLTDVEEGAQAAYLRAVGAAAAVPSLRGRTQRLVAVRNVGALPPGARVIPATYAIRSEHQVGFVIALAVAF